MFYQNVRSTVAALLLGIAGTLSAQQIAEFRFDAERGALGGQDAVIRRSEKLYAYQAVGDYLEIANKTPGRYCSLDLDLDLRYRADMVLSFEFQNVLEPGQKLAYTAINLYDDQDRTVFASVPPSTEWQTAKFELGQLRLSAAKTALEQGLPLKRLRIYSRLPNDTELTKVKLRVRNIRFTVDADYDPLAGVRLSYSALPLLDWAQSKTAAGYRVEYSADPAFPPAATRAATVPFPFFVPDAPLPAGMIHYRVTELPSGKPVLADKLIVTEPAHRWKLPDFDFAKVAAMPHPRLLALTRYYYPDPTHLEKQAEKLLDFEVAPNPEPYREGADPKIRARIEWLGKVGSGIIANTGRKMVTVGQSAMLTGRADLKGKAKALALAVSRNWNPESGSSARNNDLAAGNLLLGLGWCYDAAYELFSAEERADVAAAIRARGLQFWTWTHPFNSNEAQNHPWDRAQSAAFAAVLLAEEPESEMKFRYLAALYAYRFLPSLGFDGENNEGLAYWSFGLGLAVRFVELAKYAGGVDLFAQPWLRQTAQFPLYCAPAEGFSVSFADTGRPNHALKGPINREFTAKLAAAAGDGAALWYAGVPERNGVTATPPIELEQSKLYPHIGLAVFNTFLPDGRENVAVGFHSGKFFAGHQHADQNSFVINAYGDKLAIDGGYYDWWGSKHFRAYSIRTIAHNTMLVDGKEQAIHTPGADGRITGCFDSPGFGYVAGDAAAPKIYDKALTRFDRQLVFIKPDLVFTFDQVAAPAPATFGWLFHAHSDRPIDIGGDGRTFSFERPLARLAGTLLLPEKLKTGVAASYTEIPVQGYSIELEPNPQPEWTLTAENAAPAREAEFLAAMRIGRREHAAPAADWQKIESAAAVGARSGDALVLFNRAPGAAATLDGFETDARAAAVRFDAAGNVKDAMFVDGTYLAHGTDRWTVAAQGNFALERERRIVESKNDTLLTLDGKPVPATLHTVEMPDGGRIHTLSGFIDVPETLALTLDGERKTMPLQLLFSSANARTAATLQPGQGKSGEIRLQPGRALFSLTSAEELTPMRLQSKKTRQLPCRTLPADFRLPAGALVVEAENPVWENDPAALLERESASGGKAQRGWNSEGRSSEWAFEIPEDGSYRLLIRAAGEVEPILYELRIDGEPVAAGVDGIMLDSTGGQGYDDAEWRYSELPLPLRLAQGTRRVRLTVRSGATNLDCFALVKRE